MSLSQISMLLISHVVDHIRPVRRFEHRGRALSAQDEKQGSRPDAGLWGSIRELDSGTKGSTYPYACDARILALFLSQFVILPWMQPKVIILWWWPVLGSGAFAAHGFTNSLCFLGSKGKEE